eukprot:EC721023.1.p2 GENE.EC721023.1~~EC721023.1.p2  ORF type:complete len:94 (+),score=15.63 EC721023.1:108-389(+)
MTGCFRRVTDKILFAQDWTFWGNFLFLVGSILYVVSGALGYAEMYDTHGGNHVDFVAALVFVIDSLLYLMGWYADKRSTFLETAAAEEYKELP